jgi:hypothetical protein
VICYVLRKWESADGAWHPEGGGGGCEPPIVKRSVIFIHLLLDSGCQTVGRLPSGGHSVIPSFSITYLSPNRPDRFWFFAFILCYYSCG